MNNYFGIGLDAKISLDFNNKRDEHPEKCRWGQPRAHTGCVSSWLLPGSRAASGVWSQWVGGCAEC